MTGAAIHRPRWPFAFQWPGARQPAQLLGAIDIGHSRIAIGLAIAVADGGVKLISLRVQKRPPRTPGFSDDPHEMLRSLRLALDAWHDDVAQWTEDGAVPRWVVTASQLPALLQAAEADVDLPDGMVGPVEAARALAAAREAQPGMRVLHAFAAGYRVDGGALLPDPRGLRGSQLRAMTRLICAAGTDCERLEDELGKPGILPEAVIAPGLAAALGVLTEAERQQGAIVIEIGARYTRLAVFDSGVPLFLDAFGLGSAHVTADLAALWGGNFASAERTKLRHIDVSAAACHDPSAIEVAQIAGDGRLHGRQIARGLANRAAAARVEEILEIARDRLAPIQAGNTASPAVALTGGGANLAGIGGHAQSILGRAVRLAPPRALAPDGQSVSAGLAGLVGALAWNAGALPDLTWRPRKPQAGRQRRETVARPDRFSAARDWIATTF